MDTHTLRATYALLGVKKEPLTLLRHIQPNLRRVINPTTSHAMILVRGILEGIVEACQFSCGTS